MVPSRTRRSLEGTKFEIQNRKSQFELSPMGLGPFWHVGRGRSAALFFRWLAVHYICVHILGSL